MGKYLCYILIFVLSSAVSAHAQDMITTAGAPGDFPIVDQKGEAAICVDQNDYFLVKKVADWLQQDVQRVTGQKPDLHHQMKGADILIIGSIQKSSLIKKLVKQHKIDTADLSGKWEAYKIQVVNHPEEGIERALVIVGSDRRGTAYGALALSKKMGVSPWYWWADVPVKKKKTVFVRKGIYRFPSPAVKYRGLFINDEAPALSGWAREKFGNSTGSSSSMDTSITSRNGFNHYFYQHVFQLLLRLKANFLWPAMWGKSFAVDDGLNPVLASQYGIVMGTAHNEPMMRARKEWDQFGEGPWNYQKNAAVLDSFWRKGIQRMDDRESIVTVGMRGDGDKPMSAGTNIKLLDGIVNDQRKIISEVTGKPASQTPQVWALYKEVQDYYDQGMRVPKDITLLYSDDNWGNIRRLPELKDSSRKGGYGIYYHFDYVGGPRNYKWLNTTQISRVYEQMHLAYEYHARRIWIVNVGDIKPMEFPISFFMDYAWNADKWTVKDLGDYTKQWAAEQFGNKYADEIANMLEKYTQYNSRRKPELLSPTTYSLNHYREADRIDSSYQHIAKEARSMYKKLPAEYKPAFYQLVLYPVAASANLNNLYVTVAKNRQYAKQGRMLTNALADSAVAMFKKDHQLSHFYNKVMENGKWNHMMDQTHIGYTYWQQPPWNVMPEVKRIQPPDKAEMGVAVQGADQTWPEPHHEGKAVLPEFDSYNRQKYDIDIFAIGKQPFQYRVQTDKKWMKISATSGQIDTQKRIRISVNWDQAPYGKTNVPITISGAGKKVTVIAPVFKPKFPKKSEVKGFVENNGYVAMETPHYSSAVNGDDAHWVTIPGLGRTSSAVTAFSVTTSAKTPGGDSPHLEYDMYVFDTGTVKIEAYLSPTLNFENAPHGLRYAVSIDNASPKIVNMTADKSKEAWAKRVSNNINIQTTTFDIDQPGKHVLKFWLVDPGVVLQKMVVVFGRQKESYLGPPESKDMN